MESSGQDNGRRDSKAGKSAPHVTLDSVQEFHRRIADAIVTVQNGIWQSGTHELLGSATDFGFGRERGVQTLVLKTSRKSAYIRFSLETLLSASEADKRLISDAVRSAIVELS